jgi:hypothetical protein
LGSNALFGEMVTQIDWLKERMKLLLLIITSFPLWAQIDLSGSWAARNYGLGDGQSGMVDYVGVPLNEPARARALLYSASEVSEPERQCSLWSPVYLMYGNFGLKIWNETDPLSGRTIAWKIGPWKDLAVTTIWMDGRPHPSNNAPHETGGFTTGVWENDVLTTYTTHMPGSLYRKSGVPSSPQTTMRLRFFRHGDILTLSARLEDPIYLTEPLYLTRTFQWSQGPSIPMAAIPCIPADEGVPVGVVPHYLPGKNPFLEEMQRQYHIPPQTALGGPETMYPEYRKKLKDQYVPPDRCKMQCGGSGAAPLKTN